MKSLASGCGLCPRPNRISVHAEIALSSALNPGVVPTPLGAGTPLFLTCGGPNNEN